MDAGMGWGEELPLTTASIFSRAPTALFKEMARDRTTNLRLHDPNTERKHADFRIRRMPTRPLSPVNPQGH